MKEIQVMEPVVARTRLPVVYDDNRVEYAYPPVMGTHQECFKAIKADSELRAPEGIELALLTHGAYNGLGLWGSVRRVFKDTFVRAPIRNLWIPKDSLEDKSLSGVLIERDIGGLGLSTKIEIPNLAEWRQNESGVYVSSDKNQSFVPKDKYKLGEHDANSFALDGFARLVLSPEGAEIFAKTVIDAKLTPYIWGVDVDSIQNPEQRVCLLGEDGDGLSLGGYDWVDYWGVRAFGVFVSGEASTQKN